MKIYKQLFIILFFSFIGEIISYFVPLPIPGSILGMLLFFLALQMKLLSLEDIKEVGEFLLNNMTILFLPAGVGIMQRWSDISSIWLQLLALVLISLTINIFVTGKLVQWLKTKFEGEFQDESTNS